MNFDTALSVLLRHEGSVYSDDSDDSGGPTRYGIALNEDDLSPWLGRHATAQDIQNMTPEFAGKVYKAHYWDKMQLDKITSAKLATLLFDQCVLLGLGGASHIVQVCLGHAGSGVIDQHDIDAINAANESQLCFDFLIGCETHFISRCVSNPSQIKFLNGWMSRNRDLRAYVFGLKYAY